MNQSLHKQEHGTIIYTGTFRFPEGDAAAARVLGIGKVLRQLGYAVTFAGWEEQERPQDRQADGTYAYQGFPYRAMGEFAKAKGGMLSRMLHYLRMGEGTLRWLAETIGPSTSAVIVYNATTRFILGARQLCRAHGIPLIIDCTEWYDPRQLPGGLWGPVGWDNEWRIRHANVCAQNVIAISTYLERYYTERGCHTVRMPPLTDLREQKWNLTEPAAPSDTLRLIYAGTPGRKDLLHHMVRGISTLRRQGARVELHLLGMTDNDLQALLREESADVRRAIICHGRVPQHEVPAHLARADFSVLLRPQARYAQAGFPTKIAESLSAGTPVIANPTSDIPLVVQDGEQGLLVADDTPEALMAGITRALSLPAGRIADMKRAARARAEEVFHYEQYTNAVQEFLYALRK